MTRALRLRRLRLHGRAGTQDYTFPRRVSVITGPVGVGKSSLLNSIAYGLGKSWSVPRTIREAVDAVELDLRIGDQGVKVLRRVSQGRDSASVSIEGAAPQWLPLAGGEDELTLSRFLLQALGLPDLRVPEAPKNPSESLTTVTFSDVLDLMYLDQDQIDGEVGFTGDRHRKWKQTFEVVYGLTDSQIAALNRELGKVNVEQDRVRRYITEARRLFAAVGFDPDQGRHQLLKQREELNVLDRELASVRKGLARPVESPYRERLRRVEVELLAARKGVARLQGERDGLRRVEAQLRTDAANITRTASALQLRELEFTTCPRCLQALDARPSLPESSCGLCCQPEPESTTPLVADLELSRVKRQLAETRQLIGDLETSADDQTARVRRLESEAKTLSSEWDREAATAVAPQLEAVARLSEARGALARSIGEMDHAVRMVQEVQAAEQESRRLGEEQARLKHEIEAAKVQRSVGRRTLATLSDTYAKTTALIDTPGVGEGSVDLKRYIPLIEGDPVKALSSGGLKTMANFAYYLATLLIRLRGEPTYLPAFMMIDSPRKNFGSNDVDTESMRRFYRALSSLTSQRTGTDFQVIVADNDSPSDERDVFARIELSQERKFVDIERLSGRST